jgi:three-Cys-motif partner protein
VTILKGDCNEVLLRDVFPLLRYEDYRRGLCVLDPYGLHLDWRVIESAGKMRSIDLFINFPIMDMNRNVLRRNPLTVTPEAAARMTAFWGDESWRDAAYERNPDLFGEEVVTKKSNEDVVRAFLDRLGTVGGFPCVPDPIPMRNKRNAVVCYLMFASQKPAASKIAEDIFASYRNRMS